MTKERRCGRSPTQETLGIIRGGSRPLDPPTRLKTHPPSPPAPPLQNSSYKRCLGGISPQPAPSLCSGLNLGWLRGGAGRCFNFHYGRGGDPSPLPPSPGPPPPAPNHVRIRVLGTLFRLRFRRTYSRVLWSFHSYHVFPVLQISCHSVHKYILWHPVQPCLRAKRNDITTVVLYFRFQDGWSGKKEGTFARYAPSIQMNVPAIYHNALPPDIAPSSGPGTLSTSTLYDCWQSNNFPFFTQPMGRSHAPCPCRPHHGHPPQNQRIPF